MTSFFKSSQDVAEFLQKYFYNNNNITTVLQHTHHFKSDSLGTHINLIDSKNNITYHIKFARTPFLTFGYFFPQYKGEHGESLDSRALDNLKDTDVLMCASPNKILQVKIEELRKLKLTRVANDGTLLYHYPIESMEVFFEWQG